jgi:hypothetical protein
MVIVPVTSVVLSTIGVPPVSILTIGRFTWVGTKEGFVNETVSVIVDVALVVPAAATTVTVFAFEFAFPADVAGKASWSALGAALRLIVPLLPAVKVKGDTVIPDGRLVKVILIGPAKELLPTVTVTGTFWSPG